MSVIGSSILAGASGSAAGGPLYVDDVFSTFLWPGTGSAQTITNGIDLAGEGGLVWSKNRDADVSHLLNDSARGIESGSYYSELVSNSAAGNERFTPWGVTAFNSNGFSLGGSSSQFNLSGNNYVSWSFRKAPGFFDIVTYSGSPNNQTISHSLGSVPGMIIVKNLTDASESWDVYHRDVGRLNSLYLNETSAQSGTVTDWQYLNPTASSFFVASNSNKTGANGKNYIAYIFAHDDAQFGTDGDESIIKCGSFTGGGSLSNPKFIDVGFEAQFVLWKRTDSTSQGDWYMHDNMRSMARSFSNQPQLQANNSDAEVSSYGFWAYQNGFAFSEDLGGTSANFIYMAIRRPHKPPSAATGVFDDVAYPGNSSTQDISISPSFADSVLIKRRTNGDNWGWANRLTGPLQHLTPNDNVAEGTRNPADAVKFDRMSAFGLVGNSSGEVNISGQTFISYNFKRAPGFMDVVAYPGNNNAVTTVSHNLTVKPEIMIFKNRSRTVNWMWYDKINGATNYMQINNANGSFATAGFLNDTEPTSSVFTIGTSTSVNGPTGENHIAYLFATLPGVSKIGSYNGNTGNAVGVNCGFTAGARFILIKRSDVDFNNDWYVWDSARGIVSGNDPYSLLNDSAAEVTNTDYIDPNIYGFTVTASAPAALNATGGTYIFLAIA